MKAFFGSMTGRVFIVLLLGMLASAGLTQWLASGERERTIEQYRDFHALERAEQLIISADMVPAASRAAYLKVASRAGIRLDVTEEGAAVNPPTEFSAALASRLGPAFHLAELAERPPACAFPRPSSDSPLPHTWRGICESIDVRMSDGQMLRLSVLPPRVPPPQPSNVTRYSIAFVLSIALLAYLVTRMTMRPLTGLEQAARDFPHDIIVGAGTVERARRHQFIPLGQRLLRGKEKPTNLFTLDLSMNDTVSAVSSDRSTPVTRV